MGNGVALHRVDGGVVVEANLSRTWPLGGEPFLLCVNLSEEAAGGAYRLSLELLTRGPGPGWLANYSLHASYVFTATGLEAREWARLQAPGARYWEQEVEARTMSNGTAVVTICTYSSPRGAPRPPGPMDAERWLLQAVPGARLASEKPVSRGLLSGRCRAYTVDAATLLRRLYHVAPGTSLEAEAEAVYTAQTPLLYTRLRVAANGSPTGAHMLARALAARLAAAHLEAAGASPAAVTEATAPLLDAPLAPGPGYAASLRLYYERTRTETLLQATGRLGPLVASGAADPAREARGLAAAVDKGLRGLAEALAGPPVPRRLIPEPGPGAGEATSGAAWVPGAALLAAGAGLASLLAAARRRRGKDAGA